MLTESQQAAFDTIMRGENTFISAPGGAGKSYLIHEVVSALERCGKTVAVCAPTGKAALNIGGSTIHRLFGFPSAVLYDKRKHPIERTNPIIAAIDVLIIDEISMCRIDVFEAVVASIHKVETQGKRKIQLVVSGDFYQLPPVATDEEQDVLDECTDIDTALFAFQSPGWRECRFRYCELKEIVRQDDPEMIRSLLQLREGNISGSELFNERCVSNAEADVPFLFATRQEADIINRRELDKLTSPEVVIPAIFDGILTDASVREQYRLPAELRLKVGARVMVTANDAPGGDPTDDLFYEGGMRSRSKKGELYHNGLCGEVISIHYSGTASDTILVSLDSGDAAYIHRRTTKVYGYSLTKSGKLQRTVLGSCTQFPLTPAYACTIHKSQGQTLERVNIDPRSFAAGQLYVALSRVKTLAGIRLLRPICPEDVKVDKRVTAFYQSLQTTDRGSKKSGLPQKKCQTGTSAFIMHLLPASIYFCPSISGASVRGTALLKCWIKHLNTQRNMKSAVQ